MLQVSSGSFDDALHSANRLLLEMMRASTWLDVPVKTVTLERGRLVNDEGQVPAFVIFPEGALLADLAYMNDGRMIEVGGVGRDGAANLLCALALEPAAHRTVVKIGGPAKVVKAASVRATVQADPSLQKLIMSWLQRRALEAEQAIACSLMHDATQRLARALLLTQDRTGSSQLPLTQDDFATTLGVQRTTLNASALQLKADGAIRYSRGMLRVLDADKLAARACECHARIDLRQGGPTAADPQPVQRANAGLRVVSPT
ncbi:MAG TPA: helix-turn-helix domain-containing protein [Brevundimonas sp.]|nr:helix-turn-helix domain-containing protein [Brevundimonas sp.]